MVIEDIIVNISPIIYLFLIFFIIKLYDGRLLRFLLCTCLYGVFDCYILILIANSHGHIFPTVIILIIHILYFLWGMSKSIKPKYKHKLDILYILIYSFGIIFYLLLILFKLLVDEKTLEYVCNIVSFDYIKLFENIIENDWFKGISIGIIGSVCGGLILDKIKNRNGRRE